MGRPERLHALFLFRDVTGTDYAKNEFFVKSTKKWLICKKVLYLSVGVVL